MSPGFDLDAALDETLEGPLIVEPHDEEVTLFVRPTPLTRLNWFDGQLLRAERLALEQAARRRYLELCNRSRAVAGVVEGLSLTHDGSTLRIGRGLAVDGRGRMLLVSRSAEVSIADLIAGSERLILDGDRSPPARISDLARLDPGIKVDAPHSVRAAGGATRLYLVTIGLADEDTEGSEAATLHDDVVLSARPLELSVPLPAAKALDVSSRRFLRSRVASAAFADERARRPSLISGLGLRSPRWCGGATETPTTEVSLGIVAQAGQRTLFIDAWTVRREAMHETPRLFWDGALGRRPWRVFLAQVLQFQCQLEGVILADARELLAADPCASLRDAVSKVLGYVVDTRSQVVIDRTIRLFPQATKAMAFEKTIGAAGVVTAKATSFQIGMQASTAVEKVTDLGKLPYVPGKTRYEGLLQSAADVARKTAPARNRRLLGHGFVELPPAGFLQVVPGPERTVNEQARTLLGEGVRPTFCVVAADVVPHAFEEAQHLDRISLVAGLDDPASRPEVEILVPEGVRLPALPAGDAFEATASWTPARFEHAVFRGVARDRPGEFLMGGLGGPGSLISRIDAHLATGADPLLVLEGDPRRVVSRDPSRERAFLLRAMRLAVTRERITRAIGKSFQSLWLQCRYPTEWPAERTAGQPFDFRLILAERDPSPLAIDLHVSGALTHEAPRGDARQATLDAHVTFFSHAGDPAPTGVRHWRAPWNVALEQSGDPERGSWRLSLRPSRRSLSHYVGAGALLEIEATWGTPAGHRDVVVRLLPLFTEMGAPRPAVCECRLIRNAEVLRAEHALHVNALAAIELMRSVLPAADAFARASRALLEAPPADPEPRIEATLDWVLFRRRCHLECLPEPPVTAPVAPRLFRVFEHTVGTPEASATLLRHLDDPARQEALRQELGIDADTVRLIVAFANDSDRLLTDAGAIDAAWPRFRPGRRLLAGVIAAPDDRAAIQRERLDRVESLLAPESVPDAVTVREALADLPSALRTPDAQGAILFLTLASPACQTLFRVTQRTELADLLRLVSAGRVAEAVDRSREGALGEALFVEGTAQPTEGGLDAVATAWGAVTSRAPVEALTATHESDAARQQVLAEQARAVLGRLGSPDAPLQTVRSEVPLPVDCPGITWLLDVAPEPPPPPVLRTGRIYAWQEERGSRRILRTDTPLVFTFSGSVLREPLTDAVVATLRRFADLVDLEFVPREEPPDAEAAARMQSIRGGLVAPRPPLLVDGAPQRVRALMDTERGLLDADGVTADDLVFLQRVIPRPPATRIGRIVVWHGRVAGARHVIGDDPSWRFAFQSDGSVMNLSEAIVTALRTGDPTDYVGLEVGAEEASPDATALAARMRGIATVLATRGVVPSDVARAGAVLTASERDYLDAAGVRVKDVVFLERRTVEDPQPPPATRLGRLVVWRGRDARGERMRIEQDPGWTIDFAPNGSLAQPLGDPMLRVLRETEGLVGLSIATGVGPDDGLQSARLNAVGDALDHEHVAEGVPRETTVLTDGERRELLRVDEGPIDDVLFLESRVEAPPATRTARVVLWEGRGQGGRSILPQSDPLWLILFEPDGRVIRPLHEGMIGALGGMLWLMRLEIAAKESSPDIVSLRTRLASVSGALAESVRVLRNVLRATAVLAENERYLLGAGGVPADDVVFLERNDTHDTPRGARIVVFERLFAGERRIVEQSPDWIVTFEGDGTMVFPIGPGIADELMRFGPYIALQIAPGEPTPDAGRLTRRLQAIADVLARHEVVSAGIPRATAVLTQAERSLLEIGPLVLHEIVLLERRGQPVRPEPGPGTRSRAGKVLVWKPGSLGTRSPINLRDTPLVTFKPDGTIDQLSERVRMLRDLQPFDLVELAPAEGTLDEPAKIRLESIRVALVRVLNLPRTVRFSLVKLREQERPWLTSGDFAAQDIVFLRRAQ